VNIKFEDILFIIFILGSIQGLILTVQLYTAKNNKFSNRLLGLLTFMWAINLFSYALSLKGLMHYYPHFVRTISNIEFTFFPLLYLNVKYLLKKNNSFNKLDLLHFIPLLLNIILFSRFYFETAETKYYLVTNNTGYYFYLNLISDQVLAIQGITYSIISLILIKKYNASVLNYESSNKLLLKFMKIGIYILLSSWTIGAIASILYYMKIDVNFDLFIFTYLLIVIVIYAISYAAIRSEEILKLNDEQISHSYSVDIDSSYKADDAVQELADDSEINILNQQIIDYIESEKPYLNPELSLKDLVDGLELSRRQVSTVINQVQGVNFYEFINTYRVNEVKNNLKDPSKKHFKIISIAFDAGFNSKASFNRIFKQLTGQTPSEYMNSLKNESS
jgi:AraC-like DNA-binding protein